MARKLANLGIVCIEDFLKHYPRRYDDYRALKPINQLEYNEDVTIIGQVWETRKRQARNNRSIITSVLTDGTATIDVRMTLETPGGGIVFVDYTGRSNLETCAAYACPRFRTGVPELAWLNRVQAVAKGFFDPQAMTVTYPTVYELR